MPTVPTNIEVVVVDNGSTDSLAPIYAGWPDLRIVTEAQKGAAAARNRGVRETTAPWMFFLDADCVPDPNWLEVALKTVSQADVVGGSLRVFDETPAPRSGAEAFETVFAFDNRRYVEAKGFSVTANLLTRRDVFNAVGDFAPGLSEDLDWCQRATAQGFSLIYADGLKAAHPTRSDWDALRRKWHRITQESFALTDGGVVARLKWSLRGLGMLPSIAVHALRIITSDRLSGGAERRVALTTLARLRILRCSWMLRQGLWGQL